jgi:hypothetical protein
MNRASLYAIATRIKRSSGIQPRFPLRFLFPMKEMPMKLSLVAPIVLAMAVAACSTSKDGSDVAGVPGFNPLPQPVLVPQKRVSAALEAGEYIVTMAADSSCVARELNLSKELHFGDDLVDGALPLDTVTIKAAGTVAHPGVIEAQICFSNPPKSEGKMVVKLQNAASIIAGDNLEILGVEKVTTKRASRITLGKLPKGTVIVDLEGPATCRASEANIAKTVDPAGLKYEKVSVVLDNLIRAQICRTNVKSFASVYSTSADSLAIVGSLKGDAGANLMKPVKVWKITTEAVDLGPVAIPAVDAEPTVQPDESAAPADAAPSSIPQ